MTAKLAQYIKAGYSLLYIISSEPKRVQLQMYEVAASMGRDFFYWSHSNGIMKGKAAPAEITDPHDILSYIMDEIPNKGIVFLNNYHMFLEERDPSIIDMLGHTVNMCKPKGKVLVIVGCSLNLPPEIEKDVAVLDFDLPDRKSLRDSLKRVAKTCGTNLHGKKEIVEEVLDAARGLTTIEAENAFALSYIEHGEFNANTVAREKVSTIKKTGLLEIVETSESIDSVGGSECLKEWSLQRKHAFSDEAQKFGLPYPKGTLIIGVAGTGKSLFAKVFSTLFGHPLVKLDAGKIFGGIVGQSESNLRTITRTVEAISPCVLWIDELDKGFSGSKSSGMTDGGTSSRVFGNFISWMQEKTAPVFVVATANDVTQLPPEFLRKGRFDELWFVDLPNTNERQQIWEIQIKKHGRSPTKFDLVKLSKESQGMTGAEIEQAFIESMFDTYANAGAKGKVTTNKVLAAINKSTPLSKTMAEEIKHLQDWSQNRARAASLPDVKDVVNEEERVIDTGKVAPF